MVGRNNLEYQTDVLSKRWYVFFIIKKYIKNRETLSSVQSKGVIITITKNIVIMNVEQAVGTKEFRI